jgi:arginine decarboxylase
MGDMHNLFGRVNEVHVYLDESEQNHFYIEEIIQGQTKADVLSIMQYTPIEMCNKIKKAVNQQVKKGHIRPKQGVKFVDYYEACMFGYTYLE